MSRQEVRQIKSIMAGNIRSAREAKNLTQGQLARLMETETTNVSRWERGRVMPGPLSVAALADALGCEPNWFYVDHERAAA